MHSGPRRTSWNGLDHPSTPNSDGSGLDTPQRKGTKANLPNAPPTTTPATKSRRRATSSAPIQYFSFLAPQFCTGGKQPRRATGTIVCRSYGEGHTERNPSVSDGHRLKTVYKGPFSLLQKMVFDKGSACLFSFLIYAQNQKNWLYALMNALDPAGLLQLKAQLDLSIEAILVWLCSTWVNISGIMHPLDENPVVIREHTQLPGF